MTKSKTSLNLLPTAGYILIEPFEAQTKTASGFYLPENANTEKPQKGTVIAVGGAIYQDGKEIFSPAKVNEKVVYKKWGGSEYKENGREYLFVKFEDILAIIK